MKKALWNEVSRPAGTELHNTVHQIHQKKRKYRAVCVSFPPAGWARCLLVEWEKGGRIWPYSQRNAIRKEVLRASESCAIYFTKNRSQILEKWLPRSNPLNKGGGSPMFPLTFHSCIGARHNWAHLVITACGHTSQSTSLDICYTSGKEFTPTWRASIFCTVQTLHSDCVWKPAKLGLTRAICKLQKASLC